MSKDFSYFPPRNFSAILFILPLSDSSQQLEISNNTPYYEPSSKLDSRLRVTHFRLVNFFRRLSLGFGFFVLCFVVSCCVDISLLDGTIQPQAGTGGQPRVGIIGRNAAPILP